MIFKKEEKGQSILEVIIAMAIFGLVAASLLGFAMGGDQALLQGGDQAKAEALAQAGMEAVRSVRDSAWNELNHGQVSINNNSGYWQFSGENTTETIGKFTRTINLSDVCRNSLGQIVDCPGIYTDSQSKKITVDVSWPIRLGTTNSVQRISYLTNWNSRDWIQTDWSAGAGQSTWLGDSRFANGENINFDTTGQISLAQLGGNFSTSTWTFDQPADYVYDSNKIEVIGSQAQLKSISVPTSGGTTNPGFDTTATPWTYSDWERTNANGARLTSGGNPGAYVNISIPFVRNGGTASGFWQQAFTVNANIMAAATVSFNWRITSYSSSRLASYDIYVFADSAPGNPILGTEVWSWNITGTTNWATVSNIDVTSRLSSPGTYYIKIVARRTLNNGTGSGTNTAGFDNIQLNWNGNVISYPSDKPIINPANAFSSPGILYWSGFSETANKNGGEVYYQLSDNNGSTWQYWNGSNWVAASAANYNIALVINTYIDKFSTSSSNIMFKAFLSSDGTQQVQLDEVKIGYYGGSSGYETTGYLISSAYNLTDNSPVQAITWDEDIPICVPSCQVRLQVRTAPDAGGAPGTWTDWYGAGGGGTYFTNHYGELISKDLNWNQWAQYRVELVGDGNNAPILEEVRVNYK